MMETPASEYSNGWDARRVVSATLTVASILALFLLAYRFSTVLFIFLLSIVLSTGIRPAVKKMSERGIPRSEGVILLYLLGFILALILAVLVLPLFIEQATEVSRELPAYYENLRSALAGSSSRVLSLIASQLPPDITLLATNPTANTDETLGEVTDPVRIVGMLARSAFLLTAVFMLCFYWTLENERLLRIVFLCVPPNRRDPLRDFFTEVEEKLGGFLVGQTILCLAIGAMSLAAYSLIGLPYAFVLAIIAAIMEAVPVIGPVLGAIPALLIASSSDPTKVVWVIAASLLIQLIENYLLVPRIMKKSLGVNPLVVLLALVAFSSLFGLLGAILAIPIAAIFQLGVTRFVIRPADPDIPKSNGRGQVSFLRYEAQHLAQDMRKLLRRGHSEVDSEEDRTLDALESIVRDLDLYLGESEQKASLS